MVRFFAIAGLGLALISQTSAIYKEDKECSVSTCETWEGVCEDYGKIDNDKDWSKVFCKGKSCAKKCCRKPPKTCAKWTKKNSCDSNNLEDNEDIDFEEVECKGKEDCLEKCCVEPEECETTCETWEGSCAENNLVDKDIDFESKTCEGDDQCIKRCCEKPKEPECASCSDHQFICDSKDGQQKKPDFDEITCKGKKCKVRECCEPVKEDCTCSTSGFNCEDYEDLVNKTGVDDVNCKGEDECLDLCCKETPLTCVDWYGECGQHQTEMPNWTEITCEGEECAKKCCKNKPRATCEDWDGECGKHQNEIPNWANIPCKGEKCAKKCCEDKPTCEVWYGECGYGEILKDGLDKIQCEGNKECEKKCCEKEQPSTCSEWTGECGHGQIEKPHQDEIKCKGDKCLEKCCMKIPAACTCADWTGSCPVDQEPRPSYEDIKCKGETCTVKECCHKKKQTCESWTSDCEEHDLVDKEGIDFDTVLCRNTKECKKKCCEKPIPVCDRENLKINGQTNAHTIHLDDSKGVADMDIVSTFDGEVTLNVIQDHENILLSHCSLKVKDGKEKTIYITPQRCYKDCHQHRTSVIELVYQLPEIDGNTATCKQKVVVKRVEKQIGYCESIGDPHTKTIDGGEHSWGGDEYVQVFSSNDLRILGHHEELVVDYFQPEDRWGNKIPVASYYEAMFQYKNTVISLLRKQSPDPTYKVHDNHYCKDGHGVKKEEMKHVDNKECKRLCDNNDSCLGYEIKKNAKKCQLSYGGRKPELEYAPHYGSNDYQCVLKNVDEFTYEEAFQLTKRNLGKGPMEKIKYDKKITNEGHEHIFTLPDGTVINFVAAKGLLEEGWLVDIYLHVAARHQSHVVGGVCGDWDGNGPNDSYDYSKPRKQFLTTQFWPSTSSAFAGEKGLKSDFPAHYKGKVCRAGVLENDNAVTVDDIINSVDNVVQDRRRSRSRRDVRANKKAGVHRCLAITNLKVLKKAFKKNLFNPEEFKKACEYDMHINEDDYLQAMYVGHALKKVTLELEQQKLNATEVFGNRDAKELELHACNFPFGHFNGEKCKCKASHSGQECMSSTLKKNVRGFQLRHNNKCVDLKTKSGRKLTLDADLDVEQQNVEFVINNGKVVKGTSLSKDSTFYVFYLSETTKVDHGSITIDVRVNGKNSHAFEARVC